MATDIKNDSGLSTNLISYWELEEASGTRTDSHGGNDLTDNNTVTSTTGIQGNGASFASANSEYLSITDASQTGLEPPADFSISAWFDPTTLSVAAYIAMKGNTAASGEWYGLVVDTDGSVQFNVDNGTSNSTVSSGAGAVTTSGGFYHLCVVRDGSTGYVYVNASQSSGTVNTNSFANSDPFIVSGRWTSGAIDDRHVNGVIDELGFWNRALSSSEVSELYNSGVGIPYDAGGATTPTPTLLTLGVG